MVIVPSHATSFRAYGWSDRCTRFGWLSLEGLLEWVLRAGAAGIFVAPLLDYPLPARGDAADFWQLNFWQ